jgi:hypothetical protein
MQKPDYQEYLGDGVYASFDGYHIWLACNYHFQQVIALEPAVFARLIEYQKQLIEEIKADAPP